MIFDTHCHLNHEDLYNNIDEIIFNADKYNVKKFMVVGYDVETSVLALQIAKKYKQCYASIGIHPTEIDKIEPDKLYDFLCLSNNKEVKAIGEIGLDYHWEKDKTRQELQKEYFIAQIEYANMVKLPIIVHCREAIGDCLALLKEHRPLYGGVMHCYSGSVNDMYEFIKLGLYISLGGPVTFKNAKTPKEVAFNCPLDKLLIETDSPYLTPHPYRGNRNEPKNITLIAQEIANIKEISKPHLEDLTYKNAIRLFNINEEDD